MADNFDPIASIADALRRGLGHNAEVLGELSGIFDSLNPASEDAQALGQRIADAVAGAVSAWPGFEAAEAQGPTMQRFAASLSPDARPQSERDRFAQFAAGQDSPERLAGQAERFRDRPWDPTTPFTPFTQGDILEPLEWRNPDRVGALQRQLVQAGILEGDFQFGFFDTPTAEAYQSLLLFANELEVDKDEALGEYAKARKWAESQGMEWSQFTGGSSSQSQRKFVAPTFQPKDPAEIRQDVRQLFRELVGREPTAGELGRFAAQVAGDERSQFDSAVQARRSEFDAQPEEASMTTSERILAAQRGEQASAGLFELPGQATQADTEQQEPGAAQQFNPIARAIEAIEAEFGPEIAVNEQVEESREVRQAVGATAANVSRLTGGQ